MLLTNPLDLVHDDDYHHHPLDLDNDHPHHQGIQGDREKNKRRHGGEEKGDF